jgi:taurine dioxygenase
MTTVPLQLTPLGPYIGARVDGIDLSQPIDAELAAALQAALTEHLVLVFRGQTLSEDDQIRFAGAFGEISPHLRPDDMRNRE